MPKPALRTHVVWLQISHFIHSPLLSHERAISQSLLKGYSSGNYENVHILVHLSCLVSWLFSFLLLKVWFMTSSIEIPGASLEMQTLRLHPRFTEKEKDTVGNRDSWKETKFSEMPKSNCNQFIIYFNRVIYDPCTNFLKAEIFSYSFSDVRKLREAYIALGPAS